MWGGLLCNGKMVSLRRRLSAEMLEVMRRRTSSDASRFSRSSVAQKAKSEAKRREALALETHSKQLQLAERLEAEAKALRKQAVL